MATTNNLLNANRFALIEKPGFSMFTTTAFFRFACCLALLTVLSISSKPAAYAQDAANLGAANDSIIGNGNMSATDTGVAVNGSANDSNINNNQNTLVNGGNTVGVSTQSQNNNLLQPVVVSPSQAQGGVSALVMPRNPLHIPNASLGRKNFGMQFGVNNNPAISGLNGGQSALGWFMQAGVNIPFGKIPEPFGNPATSAQLDNRQRFLDRDRNVFAQMAPSANVAARQQPSGVKNVQGEVLQNGLSAYNHSSITADKLTPGSTLRNSLELPLIQSSRPRVLAMGRGMVFTKPMEEGGSIALVEHGAEYIYLGHTQSGWIKILLPNGKAGWSNAPFEYVKFDYTQVDALAELPQSEKTTASSRPAALTSHVSRKKSLKGS